MAIVTLYTFYNELLAVPYISAKYDTGGPRLFVCHGPHRLFVSIPIIVDWKSHCQDQMLMYELWDIVSVLTKVRCSSARHDNALVSWSVEEATEVLEKLAAWAGETRIMWPANVHQPYLKLLSEVGKRIQLSSEHQPSGLVLRGITNKVNCIIADDSMVFGCGRSFFSVLRG